MRIVCLLMVAVIFTSGCQSTPHQTTEYEKPVDIDEVATIVEISETELKHGVDAINKLGQTAKKGTVPPNLSQATTEWWQYLILVILAPAVVEITKDTLEHHFSRNP